MAAHLLPLYPDACGYPICNRTADVELYGDDGPEGAYCSEHGEIALLLCRAGHVADSWFEEHAGLNDAELMLALHDAVKGLEE